VWIVGGIAALPDNQIPSHFPTPSESPWGWSQAGYTTLWEARVTQIIRQLSPQVQQVQIDCPAQDLEDVPVLVVQIPSRR
jgi:hypothetical protein